MAKRPPFKKTVFQNGLTLLSERLTEFKSLSIGVWVKVGTRHESVSEAGASHFLEHMLFKGTKSRSALQIAREVDQVGGEFNAFTSREHTCFHILLLGKDQKLAIEILSDILIHSQFKAGELERERKVILQEISMVEESPEELAYDLYFEKVYGKHALGRPILGTKKSIKKMDRATLIEFFRHYYQPDQLVIAVAGDVDHEKLIDQFKPLTKKDWQGRKKVSVRGPNVSLQNNEVPLQQPPFVKGSWWVTRETEQVHLIWGVEGPRYSSTDRFAAFLLNVYLGGGMSSTLFQEIREKEGLAYTVYSSLTPFFDSGVFAIYAATRASEVSLCIELIEKCVSQIKNKTLTKKQLDLVKENLKGTVILSSESVESRMTSIAKNEIYFGEYMSVAEVCRQIDAVTPADLRRVAETLFKTQDRSILALGPKPLKNKNRQWNFCAS
jgi:predicted Zn-dependent peptidase